MGKHAKSAERADMGAMEQQTMQELCTDVMHATGEKFLISACNPWELTIVSHTESLSMEALSFLEERRLKKSKADKCILQKLTDDGSHIFKAYQHNEEENWKQALQKSGSIYQCNLRQTHRW